MLKDIQWSDLTRLQHQAVFDALAQVHDEVVSRVDVENGTHNATLLTLAVDLNAAMRAGDDDLVRREHAAMSGDPRAHQ
ncbi:hypothetical protein [Microbacterium sp. PF5]|uniref:hypothetical protein n=1 Tax=Microbacterium sp. PF5 TaxID=2305435 RepID=UPI00109BD258|nr:hypothetical protein [Microbacterium sp. PF5]